MITRKMEKGGIMFFSGIILTFAIVNLVLYCLTYVGVTNIDVNAEAEEWKQTAIDGWFAKKLGMLALVSIAAIVVLIADMKANKGSEFRRLNWLAVVVGIAAIIVLVIKLGSTSSLEDLNSIQHYLSDSTSNWKYEAIDNGRTYAYVTQALDIINILMFAGAIGGLSIMIVDRHIKA